MQPNHVISQVTTQYPVKMLNNTKLNLCLLLWILLLCMIIHVSLMTKLLSTDLARIHRTSIVMFRVIYSSRRFMIINPIPSAISPFSILLFHIFENARAFLCLFCFCQSAEWRNCRVSLLSVLKSRLKTKMQSFNKNQQQHYKQTNKIYWTYCMLKFSPLLRFWGLVWIGLDLLEGTGV